MSLEFEYNNDNPDFDLETRWHEIFHLLGRYQVEVTFTKVEGTVRTMHCTLVDSYLPPKAVNENHTTKAINYKTLSAWCLDRGEWRSFRVENVTHIKVLDAGQS